MNARDAILTALGPDALPDEQARRAAADALITMSERPPLPAEPPDRLFRSRLAQPSISATHDEIASLAELPAAIARHLTAQGERARLYVPPDPLLGALDWRGIERLEQVPVDDGTALGVAIAAVAETGSLVMETAPAAPMLPNFLALRLIVLVKRASIVRWLEDAPLPPVPGPRTRYWITGVSGTTDIEGLYVRGAHGPRFLHVLLCG